MYSSSLTSPSVPATVEPVARLGYRPSLDGVRAMAVLMVVGVHTHPRLVPAGSIGVDIFFVLSGFLITTLLVEELDGRGRIAVGRFYARRALRLLPALFGLLAVVTAWALLVASPDTRHNALSEVAAAASYTRNLTWWANVPGTLLGHTWSLALEEQFYLIWPVILVICLRPRRSSTALTAIFVAGFVVVSALRMSHVVGPAALLIGRPDALLLGAAVALLRRDHPQQWVGQIGHGAGSRRGDDRRSRAACHRGLGQRRRSVRRRVLTRRGVCGCVDLRPGRARRTRTGACLRQGTRCCPRDECRTASTCGICRCCVGPMTA